MTLTGTMLRALWPRAPQRKIDAIAACAPAVFRQYGLTTDLRVAHLMAQISHENGAGTITRENMNYSAPRMLKIFGVGHHSARVTPAEAQRLAHHPEQIAERVYGLGNPEKAEELGNTRPGDGWKFRGNGDLQLTGGGSHKSIGRKIGVDLYDNPEQLQEPAISFRCAVAEFVALKCLPAADADNADLVTVRVNGGRNGLAERKVWLRKWKAALAAAATSTAEDETEPAEEPPEVTAPVPPPEEPRGGESDQPPPLTKSKSLWATITGIVSTAGAGVMSFMDWKALTVVLMAIIFAAFLFIGRERIRKIVDQGI